MSIDRADPKPTHAEIGTALRSELRSQGRTIADISRATDLPYSTVERICNGRSRGSPEVLALLLDVLDHEHVEGEV